MATLGVRLGDADLRGRLLQFLSPRHQKNREHLGHGQHKKERSDGVPFPRGGDRRRFIRLIDTNDANNDRSKDRDREFAK